MLKYVHDNFFMNIYSTKNTFKYTIELSIIPPIKKKKIQEISFKIFFKEGNAHRNDLNNSAITTLLKLSYFAR